MSIAYVLINTALGKGREVEASLKQMNNVLESYAVYGVYDYIIKVESRDMNHLRDIIKNRLRNTEHVRSTLTLIVIE